MEQRNAYRRNCRQQKTCCPENKQAKLGSQKIRKPAIGSSPALNADPGILPARYSPLWFCFGHDLFRSHSLPAWLFPSQVLSHDEKQV